MPLVSIILPTYNRGWILKDCINSVLNQSIKDFELIIIDDGSTDNTRDIIHSYTDRRIKYQSQEYSGKPSIPRNIGLKLAMGTYIAFIDSDDVWISNKLELQLVEFKKNLEILLISSNAKILSGSDSFNFLNLKKNTVISLSDLLNGNIIATPSVVMKKEVLQAIGLMDEHLRIQADYDFWLRILNFKDNSILIMEKSLISSRLHESNINSGKVLQQFSERICVLNYILKKFNHFDKDLLGSILSKRITEYFRFIIITLLISSNQYLFNILWREEFEQARSDYNLISFILGPDSKGNFIIDLWKLIVRTSLEKTINNEANNLFSKESKDMLII